MRDSHWSVRALRRAGTELLLVLPPPPPLPLSFVNAAEEGEEGRSWVRDRTRKEEGEGRQAKETHPRIYNDTGIFRRFLAPSELSERRGKRPLFSLKLINSS